MDLGPTVPPNVIHTHLRVCHGAELLLSLGHDLGQSASRADIDSK